MNLCLGVNVSDIPSLTSDVQRLGGKVDFWNNAIVWAMITAALAATVLVTFQAVAFRRAKQLAGAQEALSKAKELEMSGTIALAQQAAGEANERAGKADERAAKLEKEAAALKESAESERLARVKIEERLAWRRIDPTLYKHSVKELTPFAGSVVRLDPLGNEDPETDAFAEDIAKLLRDSHWQAAVSSHLTAVPPPRGLICSIDESSAAGKALAAVLKQLPGAVIVPTALQGRVATITVGLRPPP